MKKSFAELAAIREAAKGNMNLRNETDAPIRVVVGMATCGIAAGARPVLNKLVEEVNAKNLTDHVAVLQTGCIGICQYEPIVEVIQEGKDKVTYVHMDPEKATRIVEEHLVNGKVVTEYVLKEK
jgi:NADP-reducing hydrogenase subunit HndB